MLKICTVLFVASVGTVTPVLAASQSEIAELLGHYTNMDQPDEQDRKTTTNEPTLADQEGAPPTPTPPTEACPHLVHLRTADIATALASLYQPNDFSPLWEDGDRLDSLRAELEKLSDDGLSTAAYPFSMQASGSLDTCAELHVSSEYLLALEHLGTGRFDQQQYEPMWRNEKAVPTTPAVLRWSQDGLTDVRAAFDQARPDLDLYTHLRNAYIQLREDSPEYDPIESGDLVRPGNQDARVPALAERLKAAGYLDKPTPTDTELLQPDPAMETNRETGSEAGQEAQAKTETLNPQLEEALERFQVDHGLKSDGVLGPNTLAALNMTTEERLDTIRINLERLRWINALLQDEVLLVNSARNLLRHYQGEEMVWQTDVITGRPGRETPAMVSQLNRITLNPDWTVPPTIRSEDMIPEIRKDLDYLREKNLVVIDYNGNQLDPETIDWSDPRGLMLRQPPGSDNPLGKVVFRFDNADAIYLHDTPSRQLFSRVQRNLSSGCVRVEGAADLADMLFSRMDTAKQERVQRQRASSQTHQVSVENGPQVILGYWTAEADADGHVLLTQDPYGKDPALLQAFANL